MWAPFYTYHKIMAGLLDSWTLAGNAQALTMVKGVAGWVRDYAQPIPDEQWQRMLNVEFGGMSDVLYERATVTTEPAWSALAHRFDHERVLAPLAVGRDELEGVHANTTIPKVLGVARRYERTGEERSLAIATFFWDDVTAKRSYATGGTSNGEAWQGEPGQLAKAIRPEPTKPRMVPEFRNPAPPPAPTIRAASDDVATWVAPVPGKTLEFRTVGQSAETTLVPLYRLFDERYVVYWNVSRA